MKPIHILTPTEQLALHLEEEIMRGRLTGEMPGMKTLATVLGVNHKTTEKAFRMLESKGLVHPNGTGKKRSIIPQCAVKRKTLKVNIMHYEPDDTKLHYMINVRESLLHAGHHAAFAAKSLSELKMDLPRIQKFIARHPADAWIVQSAGRKILEWFSGQEIPAFALFGRFRNIQIAGTGTDKENAVTDAVRELHQLGHRRIVMLVQEEQCMPNPGLIPRVFLNALEDLGMQSGRYNLPYWKKGSDSFSQCLESLFEHTPPTALFIPEPPLFIAATQQLAHKGIVAPDHVSMICHDPSPAFAYCNPKISHISYNLDPCIRSVLNWVKGLQSGKASQRQIFSNSEFVREGTIGPAPKV